MIKLKESDEPVKKSSWAYTLANNLFKVVIAMVPIGMLAIVLSAVFGFFGGICSQVFTFFFHIFGA